MSTRRFTLASIPQGLPTTSDFRIETVETPVCSEGGLLVRTQFISVDPYLRGRISGRKTYIDPILPGSPMVSSVVGEVIESRDPGFRPGDAVTGFWDWQEIVSLPAKAIRKIDPGDGPVSAHLGIL